MYPKLPKRPSGTLTQKLRVSPRKGNFLNIQKIRFMFFLLRKPTMIFKSFRVLWTLRPSSHHPKPYLSIEEWLLATTSSTSNLSSLRFVEFPSLSSGGFFSIFTPFSFYLQSFIFPTVLLYPLRANLKLSKTTFLFK